MSLSRRHQREIWDRLPLTLEQRKLLVQQLQAEANCGTFHFHFITTFLKNPP